MAVILTSNVERQKVGDRFVKSGHTLSQLPYAVLDQISSLSGYHYYADDFHKYTGPAVGTGSPAGGWTVNDGNTGVVVAEASSQFGSVRVETDGTENDNTHLSLSGESFRYVVGKRLWCFARLNVSDANDMEALFGLIIATADPLGGTFPTDGIFFEKAETATEFDFHVRKDGASTESTLVSSTLTDGGYVVLGFVVDPSGAVTAYEGTGLNDLTVIDTVATGNANLPDDEDLTLTFGAETGDNAAKDITIDWCFVCQER